MIAYFLTFQGALDRLYAFNDGWIALPNRASPTIPSNC